MSTAHQSSNWRLYAILSMAGLLVVTMAAIVTRVWILTAIPIGFLFGFFLQKGDLCGASAFSEIIMMKDSRKVFGLWVVIVVAMAGFAVLDLLNWVKLNPKPFIYLNYIVGGTIFGIGMVLAGGCVSGCLYKAAAGNLNSIIAIAGIPVGVMLVEFGPLHSLHVAMKQSIVKTAEGGVISLPAIFGAPFWLLAAIFGILTIIAVMIFRRHKTGTRTSNPTAEPWLHRILTRPWRAWAAGLAIGLLMAPAYLSSAASGRNYPLGVTHGVMQAELLLIDHDFNHVWQPKTASDAPAQLSTANSPKPVNPKSKKVVWWLVALVSSLMVGSWVSGRMSGQAKLLPKPPDEILVALFGGVLVGTGAALGGGCVVGNIMSGWALMSVGTFIFGIMTVLANWATTYFYMMGGKMRG